ncbi:DUF1186 domain-containing protein [Caulobacter sp. NIBR1757]|uniref:DUF1186 domain-containing protein n=1 Tax=Caulobacter sp. NIBR1757 TaxID=3016000 RepID=UPI0022F01968|nr:DUF1186 domain-containing protein [Caulobacter sp. NIBR1757]WGM39327.1 hypothetical protein AMEJIAPC_02245 [Caulobacter sp. NIBR1757]
MDRQQAAAALGIEADDLAPIEVYLDALANEIELPAVAVGMCCVRSEEAAPALLAAVEAAAEGPLPSREASRFFFRALHILGGQREQRAFKPLLRFLASDAEVVEEELGDAATETLSGIVAGVFDGDQHALFTAIRDFRLDEYVRDSLLGAATFLTWSGMIDRAEMVAFLEAFAADGPVVGDHCWYAWVEAISLLGIEKLEPAAKRVWQADEMLQTVAGWDEIARDLKHAIAKPKDLEPFRRARLGYIEDVLVALEPFQEFTEDDGGFPYSQDEDFWRAPIIGEPVINPFRNVGRNDPCPCGSGRKYKKCCLD